MYLTKACNIIAMGEGFKTHPYKCTSGKWTWGVGRNYQDYPLTINEKAYLVKVAQIPTDPSMGWSLDFTTFALSNIDSDKAQKIAWYFLEDTLSIIDNIMMERFDWYPSCDEVRKCVWLDWAYNMGLGTVSAFNQSQGLMREKKYAELAYNAKSWEWARQVHYRPPSANDPYGGRAWWVCEMMRTGNYPTWA